MRTLAAMILAAGGACAGFGQSSLPAEFEVASVKPATIPPGVSVNDWANQVRMQIQAGRITFNHPTLAMVIAAAYGIREYQIAGPDWINSERYDITATLPHGAQRSDALLMLRKLLAARFGLEVHSGNREVPVYALVVPKGATKMRTVDAGGAFPLSRGPRGLRLSGKASMSQFAASLSRQVDRPVIDETGLNGYFEITLDWFQTRRQSILDEPVEGVGPTLFEAVEEQLGLKLKPQKGAIETLEIDRAQKVPTEN